MSEPDGDVRPGPYASTYMTYRKAGWEGTLPLPPGKKAPPPEGRTGTTALMPDLSECWEWADNLPGANIALRLPPDVLGVDVDHYAEKQGGWHLWQLQQDLGPLPPTWRVTSRDDGLSGIRFYRVPVGLRWPGILGPGIETIRHGHRYAVVWPSIHPEGGTYRWFDGTDTVTLVVPSPSRLPWLPQPWIDHFTHGELAAEQARADLHTGQIDQWLAGHALSEPCPHMRSALDHGLAEIETARTGGSARHDAALALTNRLVWLGGEGHAGLGESLSVARQTFLAAVAADRPDSAEPEWARMVDGAVRMSAAAHPQPALTDPCLDLLPDNPKDPQWQTSPAPSQPSNGSPQPSSSSSSSQNGSPSTTTGGSSLPYPDPAPPATGPGSSSPPTAADPAGNATAPDAPPEPPRTSWWPRSLENAITGENPEPPPQFLTRTDGYAAFYPGRVNGIIGPSESGKSWVALHAVTQAIRARQRVTYIDFEDSERGLVGRLAGLGLTPDEIRAGFRYINPDEPYTRFGQTGLDLAEHFQQWLPALVILDGYNAAISAQGLDLNSNKDVTLFTRLVLRPLAANNQCAVYIDHVAKAKENTSAGGIGAQAKRADTSGSTIRVEPIKTFGKGRAGRLRLYVDKDRQGDVRGASAPSVGGSDWFGDVTVTPADGDGLTLVVTPPDGLDVAAKTYDFRPTMLMERISGWLADNPGAGRNEILKEVQGNQKALRTALKLLVDEAYIEVSVHGQKRPHTLMKPYTEVSELLGSNRGPTGVQDPSQEPGSTGVQVGETKSPTAPDPGCLATDPTGDHDSQDPSRPPNPTGWRDGHLTDLVTGEILK